MRLTKKFISAIILSLILAGTPLFGAQAENNIKYQNRYIPVQLLGINDLHGQINVTRKVDGKEVGGADYLAAYLKKYEQQNKNTLMVHAGDIAGASAPTSALLQDEPTIEILNEIGFDAGTVGNHEFDEGVEEMKRLIYGGEHPNTGDFEGADFPYVAANVIDKDTGENILPPYVIKKVNGMPIGFIGVVTTTTPSIVIPSAVENVEFIDEAVAVNKAAEELEKKGVESIVVLSHVPGKSNKDGKNPSGSVVEMAKNVDDEVDVIFGGHNHQYLNTEVDGKLLVQSYSYGTAFSDVDLAIDPKTKDIAEKEAKIVTTYHKGITPDPKVNQMIENYESKAGEVINQVAGKAAETISKNQNKSGESELGNLIADAQRLAMQSDLSVMNPGGIRANIEAGEITWGDLYTVQPFNNTLVKMSLTGQQIKDLLEQQFSEDRRTMLQISGFKYTWDPSKAVGEKVTSITINGQPVDPNKTYTVTANNFLASGGDGFTILKEGINRVMGPTDIEVLVDYIQSLPQPISVSTDGRIQVQ